MHCNVLALISRNFHPGAEASESVVPGDCKYFIILLLCYEFIYISNIQYVSKYVMFY